MIGVGLMGRQHAENVKRNVPDAELVAITDARPDTRARVSAELGVAECESAAALVGRDDVHAVVIASPAPLHEEHVVAAARSGKDVFVEKPIAPTLEAADRAIAAAREAGVRLQVGFHRRYDPAYAEAQRMVSSGALGRPVFYRGINRDRLTPVGRPGSMALADILTESAIHDFDGVCWVLADEVAKIRASLATIGDPSNSPAPNVSMVELRLARGVIAHIETLRGARYGYDIRTEILCEQGAIFVGGFAQTMLTVLRAGERHEAVFPGFLERYAEAYVTELRDFAAGVRDRRPPTVTGEDGRRALAVALAAARAAETGSEVVLT